MDVSIIIVNFNTQILIKQCLNSIYKQTKDINYEIIVVDNASTDGSSEMIKDEFPDVVLIESEVNLGFGKANNLGSKQASGNYIFLLNSDTILIENSIKCLKDYLDNANDRRISVVGCKMLDTNHCTQVSYGNFPTIYQEFFEYGFSKIFKKFYNKKLSPSVIDKGKRIKEVDYIIGAAMLFKKTIFNEIGGFDEDFFLYYEETDLCFRLNKLGYKRIWNPNTSIIHLVGGSGQNQKGVNYWVFEQFYKSKYMYYKKNAGLFMAKMVKYLTIPKILIIYRKADISRMFKILLSIGKS